MYVQLRSWHLVSFTDRGGAVRTRCGRRVAVKGTITAGPGVPIEVHPTAPELPLGDRSCETCLRLSQHDEDSTETVPEPNVPNDEVPA